MKLLSEQHQQYAENITAETAKRRALMQYVQNLEVWTSVSCFCRSVVALGTRLFLACLRRLG